MSKRSMIRGSVLICCPTSKRTTTGKNVFAILVTIKDFISYYHTSKLVRYVIIKELAVLN